MTRKEIPSAADGGRGAAAVLGGVVGDEGDDERGCWGVVFGDG